MQKELSKNLSNNILDFVKKLEQDEFWNKEYQNMQIKHNIIIP